MSKFEANAKPSKLNRTTNIKNNEYKRLTKKTITDYPRSYKLDPEVMNVLKDTLARINDISSKKVSEARLVKALIFISPQLDDEVIIKALKEVW